MNPRCSLARLTRTKVIADIDLRLRFALVCAKSQVIVSQTGL